VTGTTEAAAQFKDVVAALYQAEHQQKNIKKWV
jgi:hypothetical protein